MAQEKSWQERIYYGFGRTALALNEVETAHAALQEAAQANPRSPGIQRNLADACWAAHLDFDAWEAAKSALQLDPSNPNVIAWFTDHTIALYGDDWDASKNHKQPLELQAGQPGIAIHPQDVLSEALNAFNTIYPSISNQAEMVLRLGQLFTLNGQTNGAKEKLRQVSQCPDATSEGLQLSGRWLYKLNDLNGAIHAFDCAMKLCQQQGDRQVSGLAKDLVKAYLKDGQLLAAKQILQQAVFCYF